MQIVIGFQLANKIDSKSSFFFLLGIMNRDDDTMTITAEKQALIKPNEIK